MENLWTKGGSAHREPKTINRLTMLLKKSQCVSVSLPTNFTHHIFMGWKQRTRKPVEIMQSELHAGVF